MFRADVLGGTHALRVLDSSLYNPAGLSQYLEAAAQFDHAHIVRVKGAAPDRGMLVLDLPESGNLLYVLQTAVLPTTERLGWNSCVDIALAVASALQHLHNRPIPMAHGRLNAAAVYFDRHAVAKVGDVGLAALCGAEDIASGMLMARDLHSLGAPAQLAPIVCIVGVRVWPPGLGSGGMWAHGWGQRLPKVLYAAKV